MLCICSSCIESDITITLEFDAPFCSGKKIILKINFCNFSFKKNGQEKLNSIISFVIICNLIFCDLKVF